MNHPLMDAAANSYSWRQSSGSKVAAVTLQFTCTLPQWKEPTAFNGSELTPREKTAALQFRGAGPQSCWMQQTGNEAAFYHLQMTMRQKTLPTRIPWEHDELILSCSFLGNLGRALYVNPAIKSVLLPLGLFSAWCLSKAKTKTNSKTWIRWDKGMEKLIKAFSKCHIEEQMKEAVEWL